MSATDPILRVEHLSMRFGGLVAVDRLSFTARRGQVTALIGPNGAGKTTVFNCITGFYKPTEGLMQLTHPDGQSFNLERLDDHDINSRARVARTFQNIRLFQGMTVLENLMVAQHNVLMRASGFTVGAILGIGGFGKAEKEAVDFARHWLDRVGIARRADEPAKPANMAPMAKAVSFVVVVLMPSDRQAISSSRIASQARPTGSRRSRSVTQLVSSASARIR